MTNNELIKFAIKNRSSLKESCRMLGLPQFKSGINNRNFDDSLILKYRAMMNEKYLSTARISAKALREKASKNKVDMTFRCPCGCGSIGEYCKQEYYRQVTGHDHAECSFDSVYKSQFSTYGVLS